MTTKATPPSKTQISYIFRAYNYARKAANQNIGEIEHGRLNRALGLVLSGNWKYKVKFYGTTKTTCHCRDHQPGRYRVVSRPCKHMIALWLVTRMREYMAADGYGVEAYYWGTPAPTAQVTA